MLDLFDSDHYCRQLGRTLGLAAAWRHYCAKGDALGLDPSPYLSTRWYKQRYADWAEGGQETALADLVQRARAGIARQPHPLIDPEAYRASYPDLADIGAEVALHFMRHGDGECRSPGPGFDAGFYARCYLPLGQAAPFRHYVTEGRSLGFLPRPAPRAGSMSRAAMEAALAGGAAPAREDVRAEIAQDDIAQSELAEAIARPAKDVQGQAKVGQARADRGGVDGVRIPQATAVGGRPFLLAAHDAQAAGVPILTLDLAYALRARGYAPLFLLGRGGPLLSRFKALGPVFILAEGWDPAGLAAALPSGTPALVNTGAAAELAADLAQAGLSVLLLVHEMADYLCDQDLIDSLRRARASSAQVILSMPRMKEALATHLSEDPPIRADGESTTVSEDRRPGAVAVIRPGLSLPPTPFSAFRRLSDWRREGTGPVFVGAGHADRRKGFDLFVGAARAIHSQRPAARFVWLGALDGWAGDLAGAAVKAGLPLILPGFVTDSLAWYRVADCYLLTSRQDAGPTTAFHAAAMGTPFVAYAADLGIIGIAEPAGQFVPAGDEAAFVAAALATVDPRPPAMRRALRRRLRAETGFDQYVDALLLRLSDHPAIG